MLVPPVTAHQGGEGEGQEEDLVEGSGLLAGTIRQVDRTFKARMELLTGQPWDLGFKYFTEKVRCVCVCVYVYVCVCVFFYNYCSS